MSQVGFCPFCRESYEDRSHCPEHELRLVPWRELPSGSEPAGDDAWLPLYSGSHGRALVAAGAMLGLLAFLLPLAEMRAQSVMGGSMLALALGSAPRLWLVPAAGAAQLAMLYRRRSPRAMRAARVALPLVALVPAIAVALTLQGSYGAAALLADKTRMHVSVEPAAGTYLIGLGSLLSLWGGLRFGVRRRRATRVESQASSD